MTPRMPVESLEPRRLMAIDVTVPQTDLAGDANLMSQSVAGAGDGAGLTVVAWSDRDSSTGLGKEVYVRRLKADGTVVATVQVNTTTAGAQQDVDVAVNASGQTVVVWKDQPDGSSTNTIRARVYNAAGTATTAELVVTDATANNSEPAVAIDASGNFFVVWLVGNEVRGRRFAADGTPRAASFSVATGGLDQLYTPDVAMFADGRAGVTYGRTRDSNDEDVIELRPYAADGTAGSVAAVSSDATGRQVAPAVAAVGGNFIVAWIDLSSGGGTVLFRPIAGSGAALAQQTIVSQDSDGDRSGTQVTGDAAGNFTVGWTRQEDGAIYSTVDFRSYDANFKATSNETPLGDGASARTLFGLVQTGQGTFRDVSTINEFLGYGVPVGASLTNVISLNGTGGADNVVAYDLNATQIRATTNGVKLDFLRSAYAYIRSALGDGKDYFDTAGTTMPVTVDGGAGDDRILTGGGRDSISGGDGADYINSGAENDYVSGGSGDDTLFGGDGNDTLTGGAGRNRLYGGYGNDRLNGSNGRDFLYGEADSDRIYGNGGNDYLDGGGGTDRIWAGDGDDSLIGGSSIDRLYGENGNDSFVGGPGNDYLFGGPGTDTDNAYDAGDIVDSVEVRG